uniref:Neck appendage protein n=1 Tax=Siphoviridae sp. ctImC2 TaxID=2826238 RepID=A0A8S5MLF1_9CAUD|nr:MAG TPA: Neck appendage protein [Siphoviridae sp. ctImC2]
MDVFRRQKFNEAMFSKNRTLAIRVGQYQSRDINEASFDYGYIKGDTYKPGGTCAGSAKIVFASVITSFRKLDKVYPEIGLLVDGTYEWVKMGEYFINDIEIDRNRKTTELELMDGMFKLNREYVTELTYPAEIRNVIKEICLKTGVTLANETMGIASMNYRIDKVPKDKKMTFRDVLGLSAQMLGMSCFFNREGKLEVKELTDSGIVITADSYFMHGLTKSEIEYQIAGITCKKDKETLTVGLRTGRSLEIENVLMYQSALDNLYHSIKDIRYYPYSLNYQGHLLLDVGQWVTIKTNTGETFKSPVLSQSFNFKGGLRGRISADSKAGNDAQYSYAGTITKKILQFDNFEARIQNQIEEADREFDNKVKKIKTDFDGQIELVNDKVKKENQKLSDEINRRFHDFSPEGFEEAKNKAEEALRKVGANADLVKEAKKIADENVRNLNTFKATAERAQAQLSQDVNNFKNEYGSKMLEVNQTTEGIKTKIGEITTFVNKEGQRQEELKRYAREETASQATAIRETLSRDYVAKSTFTDNVEGTNQRFEALKRDNETKLAEYKQGIDGRIATITSQVAGKVNEADFQRVKETSQLYERILGSNDSNVASNIARMALTSELFEVEVGKKFSNLTNLFYAPTKIPKYISSVDTDRHLERVGWGDHDGIRINYTESMTGWLGVRFPLTKRFVKKGESLGYRIEIAVDKVPNNGRVLIQLLDNTANLGMYYNSQIELTKTGNQVCTGYLDIPYTGELNEYSLRFTLTSPGNIVIHKPMIIDRRLIPEEFVDSTDYNNEYNRVTMSLMKDSFAIKSLNSAGDLIAGINIGANGNNRIIGRATHITGETLIDNAVIKSAMIDKLKTANFEAGSVTTTILGAEAVTADKMKIDTALIKKLVSQQAFINELFAQRATITRIQSIDITGEHIRGGRISSINGSTTFNLQDGWLEMNAHGVGIKNQFPGRALQSLTFWQGTIRDNVSGDIPGAYIGLLSSRNGLIDRDHTAAGLQIWNGNKSGDIRTIVSLYGKSIDFRQHGADNSPVVQLDMVKKELIGLENIMIKNIYLSVILDRIFDNFRNIWDKGNTYSRGYYSNWK